MLRAPLGLLHPLGCAGRAFHELPQAEGTGDVGPDIARGAAGIVLQPATGLQVVADAGDIEIIGQASHHAVAVDGVARVAQLDRQVVGGGRRALV